MKRSFYRAVNNIMEKIGRIASEDVVTLQPIKSKCIPVLLYGLEACPLNKTQNQSLDFVINRLYMKLFNTSDIALVKQCQEQFNFTLLSVALERRSTKFMHKLCCVDFFAWPGRSIHVRSFVWTLHCHMWWIKIFIRRRLKCMHIQKQFLVARQCTVDQVYRPI